MMWWRLRKFGRFLIRLWVWLPVMWHDEEWDSAYLFEIMRFKLTRIRKEITRHKRHVGWEKDVRNIKIAEELLNRMGFSDFWSKNYEKLKDDRCTCKHLDPFSDEFFRPDPYDKYPGAVKWTFKHCDYCHLLIKTKYQQKEVSDTHYLWDLLKKNSARWWD